MKFSCWLVDCKSLSSEARRRATEQIRFVGGTFSRRDTTARDKRADQASKSAVCSHGEKHHSARPLSRSGLSEVFTQRRSDSTRQLFTDRERRNAARTSYRRRSEFEIWRERDLFVSARARRPKRQRRNRSNRAAAQYRNCDEDARPCSVRRSPAA